jgi:hypothetical protein
MYNILHSENSLHQLDPTLLDHSTSFLGEFRRLISAVTDECLAVLLMLGWYWHEGPSVSDFSEMLIPKIVSKDSTIHEALQQASRVPRHRWPANAIIHEGHFIVMSCNTEEILTIAKYYEELLKGAITYSRCTNGHNAVKPEDLRHIIYLAA